MEKLPEVKELLLESRGDTLVIWFNRPETRNALSAAVAEELQAVFEALPAVRRYRFVVLRGRGGVFCAGGDLKQFREVFQGGAERAAIVQANAAFGRLMAAIDGLPQLFVVAIEGAAMAGGLGIACLADLVLATADARFALTEVTLGIPPAQITPVVIERVGLARARRLLLTAQRFDGTEAARLGFVHEVLADAQALDARLASLLDESRRCAPGAVALTKQIIRESAAGGEREALVQFAAERFADAMLGDEAREGMRAFGDKRAPAWAGSEEA
ncbi:enoyl-CoA hydratase/isomerase family protein [Pseudohaliea rubra]|uniref:Isohexenylglutaconyl-CoA hydratase n=1 Tax=Pseudohaliea rubra DSM 19751 TaxID=1265313 RepID=A0A095WWX4_9GAMM|nr:enoyl-CoA hydratase-related protein [Pseudohaliea rubra]KGE03099.1 Isohexenylglutaconyl-CoA hydratase [Pseudohaliea rubra DSM 19751]